MITVRRLQEFVDWIHALRDARAKARIFTRIDRLRDGNVGDVEPIGEGVSELKVDYGPGYRIYIKQSGKEIVVLLCGGDKSSQPKDIRNALKLARTIK